MIEVKEKEYKRICPYCKKKFKYYKRWQKPGNREFKELNCPHCSNLCGKSLEWNYLVIESKEE